MRTLKRSGLLASLPLALPLALMATAGVATAQPRQPRQPAAQPADTTQADAARAYTEGRAHFDAGRFAEALAAFERAYALRSNPIVLLPIAETQLRLGRVGAAIQRLEQYLRERADAPDRGQIEQRLAELRARPGTVRLSTTPPGATIRVDGREIPQQTPAEVPMAPGRHAVTFTLPGHTTTEQAVVVAPGEAATAEATLATLPPPTPPVATPEPTPAPTPTPEPTPAPSRGPGTAVWVAGAVAGGALIAGTVFGFMALSDANEYDQLSQQYRTTLDPATRQQATDVSDRGQRNALLSDLGFGAAVLAASVALVVYLSDRGSARPAETTATSTTTSRLRVSPGGVVYNF